MTFSNWLYFKKKSIIFKYRALIYYPFFRNYKVLIHNNLTIRRYTGNHTIGDSLTVLENVVFEVHDQTASIETGNNCIFSYGVVIVCACNIKMGNNVWIGEYTSLRDSTHQFSLRSHLGELSDLKAPIQIGNNVWIGRGCIILPGTKIEDNVIVAANSVVKGHLQMNSIYGGSPVRFIKTIDF